MKRTSLFVALTAAVIGCSPISPSLAQTDDWNIGFISATSGPLKQPGDSTAIAIQMAADEINAKGGIKGRKLNLIRYDTASDPRQASVAVRTLAEDKKVLGIIGPLSSGETGVAASDAERIGVLILPYSSSAPNLTTGKTFTWRLTATEDKQFARLLTALKRKNVKTTNADIVYVSDDRIANVTGTQVFPALFKTAGIPVRRLVSVSINSFDVSTQIAQIVQQNPDILALAANYDQAVTIMRELHRQNFKGRVIGSQLFADPNLVELLGKDADGTMFVSGFWRNKDEQTKAFTKRYIEEAAKKGFKKLGPHHVDAQAFDTVFLMKQLIETSGVTGDPSKLAEERIKLRDALKGISFSGMIGKNICFSGNDAELPGYIIELKDGDWSLFDEFPPDTCK